MGVDIIFKIAAVGILTAVVGQILKQSGKEDRQRVPRFLRPHAGASDRLPDSGLGRRPESRRGGQDRHHQPPRPGLDAG